MTWPLSRHLAEDRGGTAYLRGFISVYLVQFELMIDFALLCLYGTLLEYNSIYTIDH